MPILSRDIRDQSWQLTDIATKFWLFSPTQIIGGGPSQTYTHFITPASRHVARKKFCEYAATSAEVIEAETLNFRPNFKFSRLNFLGGPPSQW